MKSAKAIHLMRLIQVIASSVATHQKPSKLMSILGGWGKHKNENKQKQNQNTQANCIYSY